MKQYHDFLRHILAKGSKKGDRTGTGTISTFGYQMRFDLADGFPLVTTKKMFTKGIIHELLWFIRGETNIKYLVNNGVHIWDQWADKDGELGPVYGKQWRKWVVQPDPDYADQRDAITIDQLKDVVERIKTKPDCRRLIVSAWNPADIPTMSLPPCHCLFQFYVRDGKLSCQLYQRSADAFLGVPFNIASYALLTQMIAQSAGLQFGEFIHTFGDAHIYLNHLEQVELQLSREPKPLPVMSIAPRESIFDHVYEDFTLIGYESWPKIEAPISV